MNRDLNDTLVFVKVVELGSFTAAAKALRLPNTTVSRKVQDLEARLGAQLLHRTTRKLGLTEAGNVYFEHCHRIARDLDQAESAVGQLQSGPRGWLRVTTTHALGTAWIAPLLSEFRARYPDVRVELLLSNEPLDIVAGEIDVALRVGTLADSNLVARKLSVLRTAVYTTPSYIERFGEPLHPDDLIHHRALAVTNSRNAWTLSDSNGKPREFPIDPIVIANDPSALRAVLLGGEGIILTTDVWVRAYVEQGQVQRVLPGWRGQDIDFNALFQRGQLQSPKVRAFIDFLVERLNIEEDYMQVLSEDTKRPQQLGAEAAAEMHRVLPKVALKTTPKTADGQVDPGSARTL